MTPEIEDKFHSLEDEVKAELAETIKRNPLDSVLGPLTTRLDLLAREELKHVNTLSLALLFDDVFDISFPEKSDMDQNGWFGYSYLKRGYIGSCCTTAAASKQRLFILHNKEEMALAPQLTQRANFAADPNIHAFCVAPVLVGDRIVGAIQLSLKEELSSAEDETRTRSFLSWIAYKIAWILFSEQVRLTNLIAISETIIQALESKDSFQANHSRHVSEIVTAFVHWISKDKDYKRLLFTNGATLSGLSIVKLRLAALLHDVGKFSMPNEIFESKEITKLEDKCKRKLHPFFTYSILNNQQLTQNIAAISASHHERADNKGYPWGLRKDELNVETQIISFADKFDSIARKRPSKASRSDIREVIDELTKKPEVKSAFSSNVYSALLGVVREYSETPDKFAFSKIPTILGLLGISSEPNYEIALTGTDLDPLLVPKGAPPVIGLDEWITILMVKSEEDLTVNYIAAGTASKWNQKYGFDDRVSLVKVEDHEKHYLGVYRTKLAKEVAYAFCDDFAHKISPKNVMAAVFLDYRMASSRESILKSRALLIDEIKLMTPGNRWRLLMFGG